jgi:hypothetical protein
MYSVLLSEKDVKVLLFQLNKEWRIWGFFIIFFFNYPVFYVHVNGIYHTFEIRRERPVECYFKYNFIFLTCGRGIHG